MVGVTSLHTIYFFDIVTYFFFHAPIIYVVHSKLELKFASQKPPHIEIHYGYFLILYNSEEGAIATRKLTTVDWSGLSLSFSKFSPNFDANAQGAEALLMHTIKVQFLDIHEQFKNARALTIMASKLGEILDIKAADFYIKRSADPMVTVEVHDITRLASFIRIPSMAEGVNTTNTIW
jgi:hypothetical protein